MADTPNAPPPPTRELRRILIESVAVVLSILLAFAVDAGWDLRQERRQERDLLLGLLSDLETSRPEILSRMELARRMATGTRGFLDLTRNAPLPAAIQVPDTLIMAALGGPTFDPVTNTLDAALASGEIAVIRSKEVREALAHWRKQLSDTAEDELEVRRITNEQVVPLLSRSVNVAPHFDALLAWSGGDPFGAGRLIASDGRTGPDAHSTVNVSSELAGALATRLFYVDFSAGDLQEMLAILDGTVSLIEDALDH